MRWRDRAAAGRDLAARLAHLRGGDPLVLALPRGGVAVAAPVAEALGARLDILLVRKIGAPHQPELALGAVVEGDPPQTVLNEDIVATLDVPTGFVTRRAAQEIAELDRRRELWGRPPVAARGRTVVLVDDGIATGATVRAALLALERGGAGRRVLAAPVAPAEVAAALRPLCDEAVFLAEPAEFGSVGAFYDDFRQLTDADVTALLDAVTPASAARRDR